METLLRRLQENLNNKLPFAVYAKPGTDYITGIFQLEDTAYLLENFTQKGFVFAPFADGEAPFIPFEKSEIIEAKFTLSDTGTPVTSDVEPQLEAKSHFEQLVQKCVAEIKTGAFDKLVASRTEFVATQKSVTDIYITLLHTYPNAFRYCFFHPVSGLWMGATPEQLLKASGNEVATVALAGTQIYNPSVEAVWGTKEKEEQQFVTDYIVQRLHNITKDVNVSLPYTFRAGNIVHIKTDIQAQLQNNTDLGDIITLLHPTPAVCGLPKEQARDFLLGNEGYNREYYSGYLGELNREESSDLFVNLRCMKVSEQNAQLFIGCGITKDSIPEKEFYETVNKSMTMGRVL
ncbi:MAG: isochorismate synthase [Flavobacterium sp.]